MAAERLVSFFAADPQPAGLAFPALTPREMEILGLIPLGLTNASIATHLILSPNTVRNQASTICSRLQVASRNEAIIAARSAGLGCEPPSRRAAEERKLPPQTMHGPI